MTVKVVEEIYCDRCDDRFEKRPPSRGDVWSPVVYLEIGWFKYSNGSGSKLTSKGRSWDNLDHDLCPPCTSEFLQWWENGSAE